MQFVIIRQIAVEAETPEEAVAKINEGNTISLQVQPRIQPQTARTLTPGAGPYAPGAGPQPVPS
jgi:hypothetical protein